MKEGVTRLLIVCCHGIWLGGSSLGSDEAEWLIAPFQREETPTFIEHIKAGFRLLSSTPGSLLIFSGYLSRSLHVVMGRLTDRIPRGPTRPETRISEAESYVHLAQVHDYWGLLPSSDLQERIIVERRSLDSFHNLLFSLTKFYEVSGSWPECVKIISNEFKRARFLELHCKALGLPAGRVAFVGIDPDYMARDLERAGSVREGERKNGFEPWRKDLFGKGDELETKRRRRNPWLVKQTLFEADDIRDRSGIHYLPLDHREALEERPQPWENDAV